MKRLILVLALATAVAALAPAALAGTESGDVEDDRAAFSAAQVWKAEMIADYFSEVSGTGSTADELLSLRSSQPSIGWGVVFKLQSYAAAGMDLSEYLSLEEGEDGGYALGLIRKAYLQGAAEGIYTDLPVKNLGQLQKQSKPDNGEKPDRPDKTEEPGKPDKPGKPEKAPPGQTRQSDG